MPQQNPDVLNESDQSNEQEDYHNVTFKCIRAALNRYHQSKRGIDITSNDLFIPANKMFKALQRKGKCEDCGETEHKKTISDADFQKLSHI